MNLLLGRTNRSVVAATAVLLLVLGACSGESSSDDAPAAKATTSATPTPDQAAVDEAAVVDLAKRYWAAIVESENTGNDDPAQFADVATSTVIEEQVSKVVEYQKLEVLRVGQPEITDVKATVTGDTAAIGLCLNEDGWTAEVNGEPAGEGKKFGAGRWGARAERIDGRWLITAENLQDDASDPCV